MMNFGEAIESLKQGAKCARKGWNGRGIFIELQHPDANSKMTHPYIFIDTTGLETTNSFAPRDRVPWLASQTDMLAEDWIADGAEDTGLITITREEYNELVDRDRWLSCLEAAGVDNWEGYSMAHEIAESEGEE